jgi:phosphate transport system substrate-binding protein
MTHTNLLNKDGKVVAPTSENFQAAAANADWKSQPGFGVLLANQPGVKSWPMTAPTWILMYKKPQNAAESAEALKFFAWAYKKGGKMAEDLHYVPMPANVVRDVEKTWAAEIKDESGKSVYTATN